MFAEEFFDGVGTDVDFDDNISVTGDIYVNSGSIGIGTLNPETQLDVFGNVSVSGNVSIAGNLSVERNLSVTGDISGTWRGDQIPSEYILDNDVDTIDLAQNLTFGASDTLNLAAAINQNPKCGSHYSTRYRNATGSRLRTRRLYFLGYR